MPKSNGPAKNSGKIVNRSKLILHIQQPFRRIDHDSFLLGVNLDANTQDERDQKFAFTFSDQEQWRGAVILNLIDAAKLLTVGADHFAADQVEIVVAVFGQLDQLIARNTDARASQLFGAVDAVAAREFQSDAPFMRPRAFKVENEKPTVGALDVNLVESGETLREISQQIGDDLATAPLWTGDPRDTDQIILNNLALNTGSNAGAILFPVVTHSRISRTKRFFSFVPEALRTVRIARAVRPCLPMTLPRSPSATRNSSTVA